MNIYVHIPFCRSKCAYCAFVSHCDISKEDEYITKLCKEIADRSISVKDNKIDTIYFGGGTPSYIKSQNIGKIISVLHDNFVFNENIEITLETNPEDINIKKLADWRACGVNRISLGVQSLNDKVRQQVGRNSVSEKVLAKVDLVKRYFENIGVDLIANLPGEKPQSFLVNLSEIINKDVCHISVYDLDVSPGSDISNNPTRYVFQNEDISAKNLINIWKAMVASGFEQYEISNFAKGGKYCRHNLDFWMGKDYLGFGLSAVSRIGDVIIENTNDFEQYLSGERGIKIHLNTEELEVLEISSILRLNFPVPDKLISKYPKVFSELFSEGLIDDNNIVTQKGKLFNNYMVSKFTKAS